MIAIDLAELVGSAIPLQLLFGLPLAMGNHHQLFLAAGIIGATVIPHNLYLHSSLVKTSQWPDHSQARHWALRFATADMVIALAMAFLVNAAILVLAGGAFHGRGLPLVTDLGQAYRLLTPMLGTSLASLAFGVALLAAGQSSTITGTLAGQVVMEGFLDLRLPVWQRRLLTRGMALIPALVTMLLLGEGATNQLLVFSEVVLSL